MNWKKITTPTMNWMVVVVVVDLMDQDLDPDHHHNHLCMQHMSQRCTCTRSFLADLRLSSCWEPAVHWSQLMDRRKRQSLDVVNHLRINYWNRCRGQVGCHSVHLDWLSINSGHRYIAVGWMAVMERERKRKRGREEEGKRAKAKRNYYYSAMF